MALKAYAHHMLCMARYCDREPKKKKEGTAADDEMVSADFSSISAVHPRDKDSVVRIVLASGMVEVYTGAVSAHLVMEKYPRLCLARPEVFKRPHDGLVGRTEKLLPGQKFYLVPKSTVKKLRQKFPDKSKLGGEEDRVKLVASDATAEEDECDGDAKEESVCSAKDFYVANEKWTRCFMQRFGAGAEKQQQRPKKPFTPPIKKMKVKRGLLGGWAPSLEPVKEESPLITRVPPQGSLEMNA